MYHPSIRIEPRGEVKISDLTEMLDVLADQEFETLEEKTAYIEGLLLGTSSFIPFVVGISSYTIFEDSIKFTNNWIIGSKRFNAIKEYLNDGYKLGACKFISELSGKAFSELNRRLRRRIKDIYIPLFSIEWTGKDTDYKEIRDMIIQQFGSSIY